MNPLVKGVFKAVAKVFGYKFFEFTKKGGGGTIRKV